MRNLWIKIKARFFYRKTVARAKYRRYLWNLYLGNPIKPRPLIYDGTSVRVANKYEGFVKNANQIFRMGMMFKSTPSGGFISDEAFSKIELYEKDKDIGFINPFEKEEMEELRSIGRINTLEERLRANAISWMNKAEIEEFGS